MGASSLSSGEYTWGNARAACRRLESQRFTLIELLVVVAIIAILAAMLLAVLSKTRESASMTLCMSNLKQIGTAFVMYGDDNNGELPGEWIPMVSGINHRFHEAAALEGSLIYPYVADPKVWVCPTFMRVWNTYGGNAYCGDPLSSIQPAFSYTQNIGFNEWSRTSSGLNWVTSLGTRLEQVGNPSGTMLMSEENTWAIPGRSTVTINDGCLAITRRDKPFDFDTFGSYHKSGDRYSGQAVVFYVDGHTSNFRATDDDVAVAYGLQPE